MRIREANSAVDQKSHHESGQNPHYSSFQNSHKKSNYITCVYNGSCHTCHEFGGTGDWLGIKDMRDLSRLSFLCVPELRQIQVIT